MVRVVNCCDDVVHNKVAPFLLVAKPPSFTFGTGNRSSKFIFGGPNND
jgi:hypothetical protein